MAKMSKAIRVKPLADESVKAVVFPSPTRVDWHLKTSSSDLEAPPEFQLIAKDLLEKQKRADRKRGAGKGSLKAASARMRLNIKLESEPNLEGVEGPD
jgi:hypothetical protein